jgi:glucosylceramidase
MMIRLMQIFPLLGIAAAVACNRGNHVADAGAATDSIAVYLTTGDEKHLLEKQPALSRAADTAALTIQVDEQQQYQEIEGFGAAITGSSAYVMMHHLQGAQRSALLRELFDTKEGIGLRSIRMSVGASDFSTGPYSYNDRPSGERDDSLKHFSIEKEKAELIPVLQEIFRINPDIHLMGSPWSAPGWMKTSGKLEGGSLRKDAYSAFARYFEKYLAAFEQEGVHVDAISVQNEPQYEASYPTMKMTAPEQLDFIKNHLGPLLRGKGLRTRILVFDHNWNSPEYPITILNDPAAREYVDGSAFHCYEGSVDAMSKVHAAYPDKGLYFTECSGGSWAPGFANNLKWQTQTLLMGTLRNWSKNVMMWNMALDERNGPTTNPMDTASKVNRGCMTCRGVVTVSTAGAVTRNVEYYTLGHFSRFVQAGARRIFSSPAQGIENVAFLNKDGSKALVALNTTQAPVTFAVKQQRTVYTYTLPPGAVATFSWK